MPGRQNSQTIRKFSKNHKVLKIKLMCPFGRNLSQSTRYALVITQHLVRSRDVSICFFCKQIHQRSKDKPS
jgi:hypothetical protein